MPKNETPVDLTATVAAVVPNEFLSQKYQKPIFDVRLSQTDRPTLGMDGFRVWEVDVIVEAGKSYRMMVLHGYSEKGKEYKNITKVLPMEALPPERAQVLKPGTIVEGGAGTGPSLPSQRMDKDAQIARMNALHALSRSMNSAQAPAGIADYFWGRRPDLAPQVKSYLDKCVRYTLDGVIEGS